MRAAAAKLLVACANVRTLLPSLFDGFVSVDVLLARLTLDAGVPAVAEPLAAVLVHSFYPADATNTEVSGARTTRRTHFHTPALSRVVGGWVGAVSEAVGADGVPLTLICCNPAAALTPHPCGTLAPRRSRCRTRCDPPRPHPQ